MDPRDYEDPVCPFDVSQWKNEKPVESIPVGRVLEKADSYFAKNDMDGAERHFLYWLAEAENGNDIRGAFTLANELMGLYRKNGRKDEAFRYAAMATELAKEETIGENSVGAATCYLNAATVYKAFGEFQKAIPLYEKAKEIYETKLSSDDQRKSGLYNNMGLACVDAGRFSEAEELFLEAIRILKLSEEEGSDPVAKSHAFLDHAITCLNICDTLMKRDGKIVDESGNPCDAENPEAFLEVPKETDLCIEKYLDEAEKLLSDDSSARDGYMAYVYEKCSDGFLYYGREKTAEKLKAAAEEIRFTLKTKEK